MFRRNVAKKRVGSWPNELLLTDLNRSFFSGQHSQGSKETCVSHFTDLTKAVSKAGGGREGSLGPTAASQTSAPPPNEIFG